MNSKEAPGFSHGEDVTEKHTIERRQGKGANMLGTLLIDVRREIREGKLR